MSSAPQAEEAWSLFDFSPLFSGGLQSFLEQTLRTCGRWFAASGGSVFLQDAEGRYVLRAKTGAQTRIPEGSIIEPGEGLAGAAIRDGQARIVQGVQSSTDLASSMILPLAWGEKGVIGVMNLSRREGESRFDSGDLELAQALASQMAAAVANALLVDELERARQAADQARERLEAVLSSAPSHILHLDGHGELRLLAGGKEGGEEALARAQELAVQLAGFKEPAVRLLRDESGSKVWIAACFGRSDLFDSGCHRAPAGPGGAQPHAAPRRNRPDDRQHRPRNPQPAHRNPLRRPAALVQPRDERGNGRHHPRRGRPAGGALLRLPQLRPPAEPELGGRFPGRSRRAGPENGGGRS